MSGDPEYFAAIDDLAAAFRLGFAAGIDYALWAERSSDASTRPDTRNPFDGRDETDLTGEADR